MNMKALIKVKALVVYVTLAIGLCVAVIYRVDSTSNRVTDSQSPQDTSPDISAVRQNAQEEPIREIRDALSNMHKQFSDQLSEIRMLSQKNLHDISSLKEHNEALDDSGVSDIDNLGSEKNPEDDPDDRQAQDAKETELRQLEYLYKIENSFASQPEDASWSVQVESDFQAAFEDYSDHVQVTDVSCGDTMCKISANVTNIDDESGAQLPSLDHIIHGNAKWQGQSFYMMNQDTGEITLYLMRDGFELPQANS